MRHNDMTYAALVGWSEGDKPCPYLQTSPAHIAWALGRFFRKSGRTQPSDVRMSRGYSIRCRDMLFLPSDTFLDFERIH